MREDVLCRQQGRGGLVSVVADLVQRDQLVGEAVGLLFALLEVEWVVEIRPRWQGAVVRKPVQMRRHGVDGRERRIRGGRYWWLQPSFFLAFVLREQRTVLLKLLLVMFLALPLLMVTTVIRHMSRRVRTDFRPIRVIPERSCRRRGGG